jgi:hypothetical protein
MGALDQAAQEGWFGICCLLFTGHTVWFMSEACKQFRLVEALRGGVMGLAGWGSAATQLGWARGSAA